MAASDGVYFEEEGDGVGDDLAFGDEFLWESLLENEGEVFGCVGCLCGVDGELPKVFRWRDVGVFENTCTLLAHPLVSSLVGAHQLRNCSAPDSHPYSKVYSSYCSRGSQSFPRIQGDHYDPQNDRKTREVATVQ